MEQYANGACLQSPVGRLTDAGKYASKRLLLNTIVAMIEGAKMQDERVSFRANAVVVDALSVRARETGCSVSEYLRSIVREKVGLQ